MLEIQSNILADMMRKHIPSRKFEYCLDLLGVQRDRGWARQCLWRRHWE